jgi:MraZ protein
LPAQDGISGRHVDSRTPYQGYALNGIDGKGRVGIPAGLRAAVEANGGGERTLFVSKHASDPCLVGYDRIWANLLKGQLKSDEQLDRSEGRSFDRLNQHRRAFTMVDEVGFDGSGRFIIPGFLRARAQLDDCALFFGVGDQFEIWSPRVLIDTPHVDAELKDVAQWLLDQRGAA